MEAYGALAQRVGSPGPQLKVMSGRGTQAQNQWFIDHLLSLTDRLACFDDEDYVALNPDLDSAHARIHFAQYGIWEPRKYISAARLTAKLSRAAVLTEMSDLSDAELRRGYRAALHIRPSIHLPAEPNAVEDDVAERIAQAFGAIGVDARVKRSPPGWDDNHPIIVNPAAVFEAGAPNRDLALYRRCTMVVTASPGPEVFDDHLPYLLSGGAVVALQSDTFALLSSAGLNACWLRPTLKENTSRSRPTHPLMRGLSMAALDWTPDGAWSDRPIDVAYLETASEPRKACWERMAEGMVQFSTVIYQPPEGLCSDQADAELRRFVFQRSKIVIHLHEELPMVLQSGLLEEVAAAGALLVTEPGPPHLSMLPGRHFIEASARRMSDAIERLIRTQAGQLDAHAVIDRARRSLCDRTDVESTGLALANLIWDTVEALT